MLSRRHFVLGGVIAPAGAILGLAGCERRPGGTSSSAEASGGTDGGVSSLTIDTVLGRVVLRLPNALDEGASSPSGAGDDASAQWRARVEAAAHRIAEVWGTTRPAGLEGDLRVTLCRDDAEFAASADGLDADTAGVTTRQGVFLAPSVASSLTEGGRRVVLAHELTHLWLGQFGADATQWWLKEGAAEWTAAPLVSVPERSRWPTLAQAAPQKKIGDSPPPQEQVGTELGYEWAHAYVTYLADGAGTARLVALVRARPRDATAVAASLVAGRESFTTWLSGRLR